MAIPLEQGGFVFGLHLEALLLWMLALRNGLNARIQQALKKSYKAARQPEPAWIHGPLVPAILTTLLLFLLGYATYLWLTSDGSDGSPIGLSILILPILYIALLRQHILPTLTPRRVLAYSAVAGTVAASIALPLVGPAIALLLGAVPLAIAGTLTLPAEPPGTSKRVLLYVGFALMLMPMTLAQFSESGENTPIHEDFAQGFFFGMAYFYVAILFWSLVLLLPVPGRRGGLGTWQEHVTDISARYTHDPPERRGATLLLTSGLVTLLAVNAGLNLVPWPYVAGITLAATPFLDLRPPRKPEETEARDPAAVKTRLP